MMLRPFKIILITLLLSACGWVQPPQATVDAAAPAAVDAAAPAATRLMFPAVPPATTTTIGGVQLAGILGGTAASPQASNPLVVQQVTATSLQYGASDVDAGNSGTSLTINWLLGQDQQVLLTGSVTLAFTAPLGVSTRLLRLIQDGAGSHTVTWPAAVKWPGGTAPTLTSAAGGVDVVSCYWNSATYDCQAALNFQ